MISTLLRNVNEIFRETLVFFTVMVTSLGVDAGSLAANLAGAITSKCASVYYSLDFVYPRPELYSILYMYEHKLIIF